MVVCVAVAVAWLGRGGRTGTGWPLCPGRRGRHELPVYDVHLHHVARVRIRVPLKEARHKRAPGPAEERKG